VVTDAAYSRSFAQTHSLRIVQSSFLTGNRMVTQGCRYTGLIPPHPFARGIAASVQHRGNLVVAVSPVLARRMGVIDQRVLLKPSQKRPA
jgi:hypothetical protein